MLRDCGPHRPADLLQQRRCHYRRSGHPRNARTRRPGASRHSNAGREQARPCNVFDALSRWTLPIVCRIAESPAADRRAKDLMPDCNDAPRSAPLLSAVPAANNFGHDSDRSEPLLPFVSIIVPVYNDAAALATLLSAVARQDYDPHRFECLIGDNGSNQAVTVSPRRAYAVRVLREPQAGSYAARNCGLRQARGEILAFTDADCVPRPDWLSTAVRRIVSAGRPLILGGRLEVWCDAPSRDSALAWHSVVNDLDQARFVDHYHFAATANMVTTREVFESVGQFNPNLFSGGDYEWGQRAWARGIEQVYCNDVVVKHPARAEWKSLVAKTRRIAGGHYGLNRKSRRPLPATIHTTLQIAAASLSRSWRDPRLPTFGCRLRVLTIDAVLRVIQL